GLDPHGVLTLQVSLPTATYGSRERVTTFYATLQRALQERLGPRAVSIVDELPLTGDRGRSIVAARPQASGPEAVRRTARPGNFDIMRVPITAGRALDWQDDAAATPRVMISRSLAERMFGSDSPIGRPIWLAATSQIAEVVGVVGQVKHRALDEG